MNKKLGITPTSIEKPFRERLIVGDDSYKRPVWGLPIKEGTFESLPSIEIDSLTPMETKRLLKNLEREMKLAANDLNFELAAEIRDKIKELSSV